MLLAAPGAGEWRGKARCCDAGADADPTEPLFVVVACVSFSAAASAVYLYVQGRFSVGHPVGTAAAGESVASAVLRAGGAGMLWPNAPRRAVQQAQNHAVCARAPGPDARRQPFLTVVGLSVLPLRCARRELTWQNRGRYVDGGSFFLLARPCRSREHLALARREDMPR